MSMSYKADLQECIDYLQRKMAKCKSEDKYIMLGEYCTAIMAALDIVSYYEERDSIIKSRHGEDILKEADEAWYKLKTAHMNERFGIGFNEEVEE